MKRSEKIVFSVFADLHYKKGMYIASVEDLRKIIGEAKRRGADFVIHAGDMCNDYLGSPELISAYLDNPEEMPVFGVYGNHELESVGNSMEVVSPKLSNTEVHFGTKDGSIGDGTVGYYYYDHRFVRFIFLDTNYSYSEEKGIYEHNTEASHCAPKGNKSPDSLGPCQLLWLRETMLDAEERNMRVVLVSHAGFDMSGKKYSSDAEAVIALIGEVNSKRSGTVIMAINGHYHTNHINMLDGVIFFDVNTVRNGLWIPNPIEHYSSEMTYTFTDYDKDGKEIGARERPLSEMRMAKNTWFFDSPLYATVILSEDGDIEIEGATTDWYLGVDPTEEYFADAKISSYKKITESK